MIDEPEIAIVGGGIGGAALATVLTRRGLSVAVLERDLRHIDRVRGEFMAPWGVAEAASLGLLEVLRGAGSVASGGSSARSCRYRRSLGVASYRSRFARPRMRLSFTA